MSNNRTVPPVWFDDTPRARRNDPVTSHEAADATADHIAESHRHVAAIFERNTRPLTALEVEQAALQFGLPYSASRIRTALPELETRGVLVRAGFVRRDGDTRRRQLWTLTGAA